MWFLKLLIYVVSNIILSITPNKRQRRIKTQTVKKDGRVRAEQPQKTTFPASETFEARHLPLNKPESPIVPVVENLIPESSGEELTTDEYGEITTEVVVDTPEEIVGLPVQEDTFPIILHEDDAPIYQNEATNLPPPVENLQKEVELENNLPTQFETDTTFEATNPVSEVQQVLTDSIQPVVDVEISPVLDVPGLVETELEPSPKLETEPLQESYSPPAFDVEVTEEYLEDQLIEEVNNSEDGDFDEEEFDEDEDGDEEEEYVEDIIHDGREEGEETPIQVIRKYSSEDVFRTKKKPHTPASKKLSRPIYYLKFTAQRSLAPQLSEQDIDAFLVDLQTDNLEVIFSWPSSKMENHLFHALQRSELIGELPISSQSFIQFTEYIRHIARSKGKIDLKRIPPVLYLISMVFCARYSESDARNFWVPYAKSGLGIRCGLFGISTEMSKTFCKLSGRSASSFIF